MTRDRFVFSSLTLPRRCLLVLVAGLPLAVPFLCAQTVKEAGADQAKEDARASDPLGPARDALADRDWARAVRLLARLRDEAPQTSAGQEAALLQSRAYLLSGEKDEAAKVLAEFLATDPEPAWAVPARLLLAGALESAGEFRGASEIYRDRLAFLRGGEYLSWLVSFYLEIADPAYEGREVDDPSSILPRKIIQHDYPTALEYYSRARRIFIPPERENE
ncbi:MAG TPA: hypothetical protein VK116_14300, partial [Planctomycetota bacterium]|nr:hypothetical protein [Planctomycetota bacterium]